MTQKPRIETLKPKKLVGIRLVMSRVENRTGALWQTFGPRRSEVLRKKSAKAISMQVYADDAQEVLDPAASFTKWAVVEVAAYEKVPQGMEMYDLEGGLYAVFAHHGPATELSTFVYIFSEWLPSSRFQLDDREHFEVLPAGYDPLDPEAEEEIWVPIRKKTAA